MNSGYNIDRHIIMGLFDTLFKRSDKSNSIFDLNTLLSLVTNSHSTFKKMKNEFLNTCLMYEYRIPDMPKEFCTEEDLRIEEEFNNRYDLSSGIISIAIVEFIVKKRAENYQNLNTIELLKKNLFPNLLKMRKKIIIRNQMGKNSFMNHDVEEEIQNTDDSLIQFTERISELASEIKNHFENGTDFNNISQYFGFAMGQVLPKLFDHKDIEEERFVKTIIEKVSRDMEIYFFNKP